ncbi:MAG: Gfo/Idh/MocA family oxidoreductase [Armatimonadetes bacterium]|nr:Gfo/Idh/MocA family oxidoreductase [Armatimonadota bacterium]
MMNAKTIRLAIIGLGNWARRAYLPNLSLIHGVEIAALCTRSRENLEAALSLVTGSPRCFEEYGSMLGWGEFDGVIVATAAGGHREIVESFLRAGYPVLCEKPLAPTVEECDGLVRTAAATGLPLQVGLEFRYAPNCVRVSEVLRSGGIGRPSLIWCHVFRDKARSVLTESERYTLPGGVFSEFLCHYLDLMTWFAGGSPASITVDAGRRLGTPSFDHGSLQMAFANDAVASLSFSMFAPRQSEEVRLGIVGDAGAVELDLRTGQLLLSSTTRAPEVVQLPDPGHPSQPYPGCYEQIVDFAECIRARRAPKVDAAIGRNLVALTLAADASAKANTKRRISMSD